MSHVKLRPRALEALDSLAHFLYCPGMAGRRIAVARWYHRIHLIPGWLLTWVCDRWDRAIWAEFDTPEADLDAMMADADETFYEDDEPVEQVVAAFERGQKGITALPRPIGWKCSHFSIAATAPGFLTGPPTVSWCDCEMQPIYATWAAS